MADDNRGDEEAEMAAIGIPEVGDVHEEGDVEEEVARIPEVGDVHEEGVAPL
jgi:hypothetical protein